MNDVPLLRPASAQARQRAHRLDGGLAVALGERFLDEGTEPRIWVRRDLLMMVRRAILRVAFFAEDVLAMLLTDPSAAGLGRPG